MARLFSFLLLIPNLHAAFDLNGDGASEIWNLRYQVVASSGQDSDHDGRTDLNEAIAGTDPQDPNSGLSLEISKSGEEAIFSWSAVAGKQYTVEQLEVDKTWAIIETRPPLPADLNQTFKIPLGNGGVYRLKVTDVDLDRDGLSQWEEILLGLSDEDPQSAGEENRTDFASALRILEAAEGTTLTDGAILPRRLPSDAEAARFLFRTTFGPTSEEISKVMSLGFSGWLDEQMTIPVLTTASSMSQNRLNKYTSSNFRHGLLRATLVADDQLRHRMAYALSQIFVISTRGGTWVGDTPAVQAKYYDIFVNQAFGNYRDVLEQVTYSPVMGFFLSHLKNRKSDPAINRFPDENFAREIMQLFTIGLWELNANGSRKVDSSGKFIPTYDNSTITEMAKIFTGMSFTTSFNGRPAENHGGFYAIPSDLDFLHPMQVWPEEHEPGPKTIISGITFDGSQTGEEEVQATLDALILHPSTAPFVSRLLIQRFTSSNPSPEYLERVSNVFSGGDSIEETGNLGPLIEAILLDPDVLNSNPGDEFHGKLREPIIAFYSLLRTFGFEREEGNYGTEHYSLQDAFGQSPTLSPSVFNFYLPDFSPAGEFRAAGKYAPEFQLATTGQLLSMDYQFWKASHGFTSGFDSAFTEELALASDPVALVDHLDLLLTGRQLSPANRSAIITAVMAQSNDLSKVRTAVYLVCLTPESLILK